MTLTGLKNNGNFFDDVGDFIHDAFEGIRATWTARRVSSKKSIGRSEDREEVFQQPWQPGRPSKDSLCSRLLSGGMRQLAHSIF